MLPVDRRRARTGSPKPGTAPLGRRKSKVRSAAVNDVTGLLDSDETGAAWVQRLEAGGEPDFELVLPSADDLPPVLLLSNWHSR